MNNATSNPSSTRPPLLWPLVLCVLATVETALAIFQWRELKVLEAGGQTTCGFTDQINCDAVWTSPFAHRIHDTLNLPIAALGVVWGLIALVVSTALIIQAAKGPLPRRWVQATRVTGIVGALASITWLVGSLASGAVCPTCIATYVLVLGFAGVALFALPHPTGMNPGELMPALAIPGGVALAAYLALVLAAGSKPPAPASLNLATRPSERPNPSTTVDTPSAPKPNAPPVEEYVATMSPAHKQILSDGLEVMRKSAVIPSPNPPRQLFGPVNAPVRIVEWTDIRCGHCATLSMTMRELKRFVPEGKMAIEPRYYPLDSACNANVRFTDGTGIRCTGAKAQVCLEGAPDYWKLVEQMFAEQHRLTRDRIIEIASSGSVSRDKLLECMQSPETDAKLKTDIEYATRFKIEGTPLVVVNGREAAPQGPFLYSVIMAGGDVNHPAFSNLPTPRPPHAGHAH